MLTKDQAADIFDRVKKLLRPPTKSKLLIYGGKSALTRFANNTIHQNVAEENYVISVRTAFGGRTARATTNKFDDESLKRVVQASESLAKVQHPDSDLLPMPDCGRGAAQTTRSQCPAGILLRPRRLLPSCAPRPSKKIVSVADRHKLTTAGIFSIGGIRGRHFQFARTERLAYADLVGNFHHHAGRRFVGMAEGELARCKPARSRCPGRNRGPARRSSRPHPREIPAGKYTVILEPAAVLDMVGFMFWDFGGLAILDQRSFLEQPRRYTNFRRRTSISGTTSRILCSRARRSMAKACRGSECSWSKMAW